MIYIHFDQVAALLNMRYFKVCITEIQKIFVVHYHTVLQSLNKRLVSVWMCICNIIHFLMQIVSSVFS